MRDDSAGGCRIVPALGAVTRGALHLRIAALAVIYMFFLTSSPARAVLKARRVGPQVTQSVTLLYRNFFLMEVCIENPNRIPRTADFIQGNWKND
jgi:hypothetical protein